MQALTVHSRYVLTIAASLFFVASSLLADSPLALHPKNPRYFVYRDKPMVVVGSAEHYGAVVNLDFDYVKYLNELAECGLNHTRTFVGSYVEDPSAFGIAGNTLAPTEGRFICPWKRSDQPGYLGGGTKFDLSQWDDAYFARLKGFVREAEKRDVIVEINLFCPFYADSMWRLSPQNAVNNIQGIGAVDRQDAYTPEKNGKLQDVQEQMTSKIVRELNEFNNVYYEICNEPYIGNLPMHWQKRIAKVIAETETSLPKKHLISINYANGSAKANGIPSEVKLVNFHYANPPRAIWDNWNLNLPIGNNETGFAGTGDDIYRQEAWQFFLAGGALFSHLDYSFSPGFEDGTFSYPDKQPGGGSRKLRRELSVLREFMQSLDLLEMTAPSHTFELTPNRNIYMLASPGRVYAAYVRGEKLGRHYIPDVTGDFDILLFHPESGERRVGHAKSDGEILTVELPTDWKEVGLRITKAPSPGNR